MSDRVKIIVVLIYANMIIKRYLHTETQFYTNLVNIFIRLTSIWTDLANTQGTQKSTRTEHPTLQFPTPFSRFYVTTIVTQPLLDGMDGTLQLQMLEGGFGVGKCWMFYSLSVYTELTLACPKKCMHQKHHTISEEIVHLLGLLHRDLNHFCEKHL